MKITKENLLENIKNTGGSLQKLAEIYNVSTSTISRRKKEFGLISTQTKHVDIEELRKLYLVDFLSISEIARILGISRDTVNRRLEQHNIYREEKYDINLIRELYSNKNYNISQLQEAIGLKNRDSIKRLLAKHNITNPIKDSISNLYTQHYTIEEIASSLNLTVQEVEYNLKHHSIYREKSVEVLPDYLHELRQTNTLKQIATKLNCSPRTVSHLISTYDLGTKVNNKYFNFSYDELYDLYITKNLTSDEIANIYGCCRKTINNNINMFEITKHTLETSIERKIKEILVDLNIEFEYKTRKIIKPYEIDFFVPSKNIGIEVCGLYWHSTRNNKNKYHIYDKFKLCQNKDIRLITIFEDEINNKFDIVKNRLISILGKAKKPNIYARQCIIKEITPREGIDFINATHIQGAGKNNIYLGLFHNNILVSVMSFSNLNPSKGGISSATTIELNRFVNPFNIPGAASKLFTYFTRNYSFTKIISYADLRWNSGTLYTSLGFKKIRNTKPNYWYVIRQERKHRFTYTKSKLIEQFGVTDTTLTEEQIAESNDLYRIYDCGNLLFHWDKK